MLLPVFGAPSALTYATDFIVQNIAQVIYDGHVHMQANLISEFRSKWDALDKSSLRCVTFFSDCPQSEVSLLLASTSAPVLIVNEDFRSVFLYVMRTREMEFPFAARFMTQVACTLNVISRAQNGLHISPADLRATIPDFVDKILRNYGLDCSEEQFSTILKRLGGPAGEIVDTLGAFLLANFPASAEIEETFHMLCPEHRQILAGLDRDYGRLANGGTLDTTIWPPSLFMKWDAPVSFLSKAIDLQGPARFIICGPYLHLPAGAWRLTAQINIEGCFSDNRIGADIFCTEILTAITAKLPPAGRFEFHLDFIVVDPLAPIEMRIQLLTGAIEGRLLLSQVQLTRLVPQEQEVVTQ